MQIHGTAQIHAAQSISPPHRTSAPETPAASDSLATLDQLDISQEADLASRMQELPEIRADRVAAIRTELAAGTYDTDDKLEMAISRLLDEIG